MSLKDLNLMLAGVSSLLSGSRILSDFVPDYDATVGSGRSRELERIISVGMNNTFMEFACGMSPT